MTPNRADCLGIIGVARDVAVLSQLPLVEPEIVPVGATIDDTLPITVERRKPARVILAVW